jgi:polysaccharide deacetylase 2 family uncharacterized protein YibQ
VADDELNAPLGRNAKTKKRRLSLPISLPQATAGLLGLFLAICAVWAALVDDPLGGEPAAVVATSFPAKSEALLPAVVSASGAPITGAPQQPPAQVQPPQTQPAAAPPSGTKTITIIDGSTGKRQEVAIPAQRDARAPLEQRLLEASPHGAIPRIAPDGVRPVDAYAQPLGPAQARKTGPRIAIVLGGLGVSASLTRHAMEKLLGPVTLAFLPYSSDVESLVSSARAGGHEVLLQTPMEPFDYPDNDPGPQTLLTSLAANQNLDRFTWLMSRFQGYVGIVNYMGARFTSTEAALAPVLKETARRGLIYIDDGSSPRSLASQIAGANNLPFAKAEVMIDAVPTPALIDRALAKLEALARQHGSAIGIATPLPASIDRIAQWAKTVEARGFVLAPITAIANKPKSS